MKEHWPRWIFASCTKFFYDRRQGLAMFIEGQDRRTDVQKEYIEFRMDGPYIRERTKNHYIINTEINILIVTYINQEDLHRIYRQCGIVVEAFERSIPVRKYGDTEDDDQTLLGCLVLKSEERDQIIVTHFGQIKPEVQVLQATVEAHYEMYLRG